MPTAAEWKATGNEHLKKQEYDKAIEAYTQAIAIEKNHVFFSNRSAAYANKGSYAEALADAESCIEAKPDWPKGYSRKGAALEYLNRHQEAMQAYMAGLQHDKDNASLNAALQNVVKVVQQQQQWMQQQQAQARARTAAAAQARAAQAAAGGQSQEGKEQAEALMAAFGDDMIPNLESNPQFRKWFEEDEEFHKKILEVQRNPMPILSQIMSGSWLSFVAQSGSKSDQSAARN